jgi:hypothetical protein
MTSLPAFATRGERARLFPVLADTSKEGRTLSILLACLENVSELGRVMLTSVGQRVSSRSTIETYTEVVLQQASANGSHRPDGLLVLRSGSSQWTALVEAKVGTSLLTSDQVESYLDLAKLNGVDALITISNQFPSSPSSHPVEIGAVARKKASLFHWPWMHVLTNASLLLTNEEVADRDQRVILHEMVRFLTHQSAGVQGFAQMPAAWSEVVAAVQAGATISTNASNVREAVAAWHQLTVDLSLVLSRQLGRDVSVRVSRAHAADPSARQKADLNFLADAQSLSAGLVVPDAAAPIDILADFRKRAVTLSMHLAAPAERQSTKARLNWLLRQIQKSDPSNVYIRLNWRGRAQPTLHSLSTLRESPDIASAEREELAVTSFHVLLVRDLGGRFAQRRNFVSELATAVPAFYEQVGQHLRAWQAPAPKVREEKADPESVGIATLRKAAEESAMARQEKAEEPPLEQNALGEKPADGSMAQQASNLPFERPLESIEISKSGIETIDD